MPSPKQTCSDKTFTFWCSYNFNFWIWCKIIIQFFFKMGCKEEVINLFYTKNPFLYSRISEKSSTRITSCIRWSGDLSKTEWTVLTSTDHASLWKHIITAVGGSSVKYLFGSLHLKLKKYIYWFLIHERYGWLNSPRISWIWKTSMNWN